jgi:hypothetical protein
MQNISWSWRYVRSDNVLSIARLDHHRLLYQVGEVDVSQLDLTTSKVPFETTWNMHRASMNRHLEGHTTT